MFRFPFFTSKVKQSHKDEEKVDKTVNVDQHSLELSQFHEVLESFGATRIQERLLVLNVFLSTEKHVTIEELLKLVNEKDPKLEDSFFLEETMELFCRFGFAQEISFDTHKKRYEHHHLGDHHDHFICTRCGRIQEFISPKLEKMQLAAARDLQFHPLQHKMEIYGLCAQCMGQRDETIPLHMALRGERVRIVQLIGDRELQARLTAMGLAVDNCLEVLNNSESGPFIIASKGSRMALSRDITQQILVAHSCAVHELKE